jgi:hypothetical protein
MTSTLKPPRWKAARPRSWFPTGSRWRSQRHRIPVSSNTPMDQRLRGPLPANRLGGSADAGIEAVAGIQAPVMANEGRLCLVQVADIVFGWILRAPRVQQCPHPML